MSPTSTQRAVERLQSAQELAERVLAGHEAGEAMRLRGASTRAWLHPIDARPDCTELQLADIRGIEWIDAEDRTCRVAAGTSLAELDAALAEHALMLPWLDAGTGTVGGAFLSGSPSLCGASWGMPRDQVLGAAWVLPDGRTIESGTRVVKSVAGYDLTRLFLGSRGRLAACTALTLRLRPRPKQWLLAREESASSGSCWLNLRLPAADRWSSLQLWIDPLAVPTTTETEALDEDALNEVLAPLRERLQLQRCWVAESQPKPTPDLVLHDAAQGLSVRSVPQGEGWPRPDSAWLSAVQAACARGAIPFGGAD